MPQPHSRNRLTPDDLARRLAGQVASKKPPKPHYRLRDSVLVGRLIAVVAALIPAGVLVAAVVVAIQWWSGGPTAAEVLATETVASDPGVSSTVISNDPDPAGIHGVQPVVFDPGSAAVTAGFLPQLPSPTTTSPVVQPGATTTDDMSSTPAPSTAAPTITSPLPTITSVPSTTSTLGSTSTSRAVTTTTLAVSTTTVPVSTTTLPVSTTTIPPTTTTPVATTATCPGNSEGNGNAPCGP